MKSGAAVQAAESIQKIRKEVEDHREALGVGEYVKFGSPIVLRSGTDRSRALHNHTTKDAMGGTDVNAQPLPATNVSADFQWTVLRSQ